MAERMSADSLEKIQSDIGSVQGSMSRWETMTVRFKIRLDEVIFDHLPALLTEVRRLRKLESKIEMEIARNYQMLEMLRADHLIAFNAGRDMAANQMSDHMARIAVENKVLVKLHHG